MLLVFYHRLTYISTVIDFQVFILNFITSRKIFPYLAWNMYEKCKINCWMQDLQLQRVQNCGTWQQIHVLISLVFKDDHNCRICIWWRILTAQWPLTLKIGLDLQSLTSMYYNHSPIRYSYHNYHFNLFIFWTMILCSLSFHKFVKSTFDTAPQKMRISAVDEWQHSSARSSGVRFLLK